MKEGLEYCASNREIERHYCHAIVSRIKRLGVDYIGFDREVFLVGIDGSFDKTIETISQRIHSMFNKVEHIETEYHPETETTNGYIKVFVYTNSIKPNKSLIDN